MLRSIVLLLALLASLGSHAKEVIFECKNAKVKMDIPENKFRWVNYSVESVAPSCEFKKPEEYIEYSEDYPFGGIVYISEKRILSSKEKTLNLRSSKNRRLDTWRVLLKKRDLYSSRKGSTFKYIGAGYYNEKYLARTSEVEETEIIGKTVFLHGIIFENKVLVEFSVKLPYKSLTESEVVEMMKSVEVIQGFDAANISHK